MNLKTFKYLKHIQLLRQTSKQKSRQEVDVELEDSCTNSVDHYKDVVGDNPEKKNCLKFQKRKCSNHQSNNSARARGGGDAKVNGLVCLNNNCYQIECLVRSNNETGRGSSHLIPSIRKNRGSICVSNSRYSLIGRVSKTLGFKLAKENQLWNILWMDSLPGIDLYKNMKRFQQINHFPGMIEICRKDLLSRNLNRMLKLYPKDYKIFPKTWVFPADYGEALSYASSNSKQNMFILKPDSGAGGRGISLTNDLKNISPTERVVCQTYIRRPLLIDGYKFDLRVYALITSIDPLKVFVYNEGLTRLASKKYIRPSPENSTDLYMHLTNYSVNKCNSQYEICESGDCGSKRNFNAFNNWMRHQNFDVKKFWNKIDDIVIKTILSAWPTLKHNYHACFPFHDTIPACFEILGFDFLIDSKNKPYLLEVNHSPSFHINDVVDRQVKWSLIHDTLSLLGTLLANKRQILREDKRRIKQRILRFKLGNLTQRRNAVHISSLSEQVPCKASIKCPDDAIAEHITREGNQWGNYRCIMPLSDPGKLNYYCQFYDQQNEASIFAKTTATKQREEISKKLRQQLEERKLKETKTLRRKSTAVNFEQCQRKRTGISRLVVDKQRDELMCPHEHWSPCFISPSEDHMRIRDMQFRGDMLNELKIREVIYSIFYDSDNLSKTDINKFPHLYRSLKGGMEI